MTESPADLFSHTKFWAECYGTAPFLPMSRAEMEKLGWDSCDIIIISGDAYVDHPSFGMAVIGRTLESHGFRVGIIAQPNWRNPEAFMALGPPNLFFGVSAGNMDSMINRYTADLKRRSDDAYTPNNEGDKRPDRAVIVYSQLCRQAYANVPIVIGGIEASLRRIAQYDYWSNKVRRSVLIDSAADILLYGNAERAIVEIAHQLTLGRNIEDLSMLRGTAVLRSSPPVHWTQLDAGRIDWPAKLTTMPNPYTSNPYEHREASDSVELDEKKADEAQPIKIVPMPVYRKTFSKLNIDTEKTYIRIPSFEKVSNDPALYAHASRILHQESNPHNAKPLIQKHGNREVWVNPPPIPLKTEEIDAVFGLPFQRKPHPAYGDAKIPAYEMIKFSINIMRGCFGGCTFCSITEHEGRIIQSRSEASILQEVEDIRDKVPGFTGIISDLGGPTANMYQLNCKDDAIQANCKRLSCIYPGICKNLLTDHTPTTQLYRKTRKIPGVKQVAIASGLRYDLAVEDPEYVKELVTHHVGGYLKIAPEHSEQGPLSKMMKPGMETYHKFKAMFDHFSKQAGKKQYLIPYFIAGHPGCEDADMLALAQWLKRNKFRLDQVQSFYPTPMSLATAMYYSQRNPLHRVSYKSQKLRTPRDQKQRRLQKALLRYHDEKNWPLIREWLESTNQHKLIGDSEGALIPMAEPPGSKNIGRRSARKKPTAINTKSHIKTYRPKTNE